ncbi:3'-5' exonuclease [Acetobacterium woodii]|uniref:DNA polymerase III PolC1 n=1 Tax=Acetobacterium woodii (strain ATCC 29683 / DSM 1030 / JCM 2381 / KCTC 1655 / WB1) TaxID=931626 RepID=H6LII8_ACEWD|nr:3'-5' exonuclease [Acetobacterium woodii]AFA48562.1 DNA polymerase III PolC1 [Acetobacterium woodii DSM 1030]
MNTQFISRQYKGQSLLTFPSDYVIIDIETTGFNSKSDEIIEIGAVKVTNNKISSIFQSLAQPRNPISNYISNLTGISNDMLAKTNPITMVLDSFLSFVGDHVLIGHNINTDVNFLYDQCEIHLHQYFKNDYIDIKALFREQQQAAENYRITTLCEKCALQNTHAHRALSDCLAVNNLYQSLKTHAGIINCVEDLDNLILVSEFKNNHSPYHKQCQKQQKKQETDTPIFMAP